MNTIFSGGVPLEPDVKLLMALGPGAGVSISYELVAETIVTQIRSGRFWTVTNAWRKRLFRDQLLRSIARQGAFHFLTADGAHEQSLTEFGYLRRRAGRQMIRTEAVQVDALSPEKLDRHTLLRRESALVADVVRKASKRIFQPGNIDRSLVRVSDEAQEPQP